jgi:hypothetical protein
MSRSKTGARRRTGDDADTMRPEYDFSKGIRGQTYKRYMQGTNVVVLDPDVAKAFPNGSAVNDALRVLVRLARARVRRPRTRRTA